MPRAGVDSDVVLQAAVALADSEGLENLTIAKLASFLGIKAPSLYNHIRSLEGVKDQLTTQALRSLLDRSRDAMAGVAGQNAMEALGHSQRRFAKDHPGLWAATHLPVAGWSEASQTLAMPTLLWFWPFFAATEQQVMQRSTQPDSCELPCEDLLISN